MKVFLLLSPTLALADILKTTFDRTATIKFLNSLYLSASVLSVAAIATAQYIDANLTIVGMYKSLPLAAVIAWFVYLMSRNNEIFWAFELCSKLVYDVK